jgi:hypothetical protein
MLGLTTSILKEGESAMKSVAQTISGRAVTATADASRVRRGGAVHSSSATPLAVADLGKIRLGGACRMPMPRKAA